MKKLLITAVVVMLAVSAGTLASGILKQVSIPVMMMIDKTVTLDLDPNYIMLHIEDINDPNGGPTYQGFTRVDMTNNFPVYVTAAIFQYGPSLGPAVIYQCDIADTPSTFAFAGAIATQWYAAAPAPVGVRYYVGARVMNVDITYIPSDPNEPQQVAEILLTVNDAL